MGGGHSVCLLPSPQGLTQRYRPILVRKWLNDTDLAGSREAQIIELLYT